MERTRAHKVDLSIRLSKEATTRKEIYTKYYNSRHRSPLHNVQSYKVTEHNEYFSLDLELFVLGTSIDEVHLMVDAKSNEFYTSDRLGTDVLGIDIISVKLLHSGKTYDHTKDNIDVSWVVDHRDMYLFEIELDQEIESSEGNETSTIRIDVNKETLAHGLYTTFSEDYDIGDEINPELASIDVEEIVPFLVTHRHQFHDMTQEYRQSYMERGMLEEIS